jgi:hypothetical protein
VDRHTQEGQGCAASPDLGEGRNGRVPIVEGKRRLEETQSAHSWRRPPPESGRNLREQNGPEPGADQWVEMRNLVSPARRKKGGQPRAERG